MSAPLLTPLDSPIFDDDVIAEMEGHLDDVPACMAGVNGKQCGDTATHAIVCARCGRHTGVVCTPHAEQARMSTRHVTHAPCGARGETREIAKVVPL